MKRRLAAGACALALVFGAGSAGAQTLPVVIPQVSDPLLQNLTIPLDAPERGLWSPVMTWPLVAIHVALLPDGSVLTYGSPLGQGVQEGRIFDRWDPLTGAHLTSPNSQGVNSFCSAGVLQPFGTLLVSGGNEPRTSTIFDYFDGSAITEVSTLAADRWYATMTMLADGRTLITGGGIPYHTEAYANPEAELTAISMTPEIYTPGGGWQSLFGATSRDAFGPDFNRWWYPRQWVAPNGEVFGISTEKIWALNPAGPGSIRIIGTFKGPVNNTSRPNVGPTSTAVMYDVGKILQAGGNGYTNGYASNSSALATTFDINGANPVITEVAAMHQARQWANSIVLPTGEVLVTGGTRFADSGGTNAVFQAELWDPATGVWDELSSAAIIRNYHSSTILLPNGIIFSAGGGVPGPVTNLNAELFYPPYLFQASGGQAVLADRPRLISMSGTRFDFGSTFQAELADSRAITKVALLGASSTTHSFNMGQRYFPASFTQTGAMLTIGAPASGNLAPPGFYLLVVVDTAGVPSLGQIVALGPPECTTDLECDDADPCTDEVCDGICFNPDNGTCVGSTDPVASYSFDELTGTVAGDSSGNANHGVLVGGASFTAAGAIDGAVSIAGGTQHADLPDALVQPCTDLTVATWVRLTTNPNWARIFDFGSSTATNMFLTPAAGNADTLRFAIKAPSVNGGAEVQISYPFTFPLATWTHVAVTLEGTTGRLYVNGAQVATNTNIDANPSDLGVTVNDWLGRSQYTADPALNGALDELEISCRPYSAAEIASLATPEPECVIDADCDDGDPCTEDVCDLGLCYEADTCTDPLAVFAFDDGTGTVATDSSGNANHGTLVSGASFTTAGSIGGAVSIAGGSQHVDLPDALVQPCADLTVATWVRLTTNPNWARIFDFGSTTATNMFLTPAAGNANTLRFAIKAPGINGGAEAQISYPFTFPLATWTHVAVTLEGDTGRLYVNGAQVATNANIVANPSDLGATVNDWLGRSQYTADPRLNGALDQLEISCRAYTAAEIAALAAPGPVCGAGGCQSGETCSSCPADCGPCPPVCGANGCETGETCSSCPADCGACPPVCGANGCETGETCSSCPADCGACPPVCGANGCEAGETCSSCPADCGACPPVCGLNGCEAGETCSSCPADCGACPPVCGVNGCEAGETCSSCPADCGPCPPVCGANGCEPGETCSTCPADCGACPPVCGANGCEPGETCSTCPADCGACPPVCGANGCEPGETCSTCTADCGVCPPVCGINGCEPGETCSNCPVDCGTCGPVCGANGCEAGESCSSCPSDCGQCPNLLAHYAFDSVSGTSALDSSGNGRHGTLSGATWTAGRIGGAVSIAGGTQFVDLPDGLVQSCSDLTIASWVRLTSNPTWGRIFDFGSSTTTNMFLSPAAGNASTLRFAIKVPGINGGAEARISHAFSFPLATWTHVAVVLEGNTGRLYVNGAHVAANTNIVANPSNLGNTVNDWLGRSQFTADPRLNGALDEMRISCRAYAPAEISALAAVAPSCGNGTCSPGETCGACPSDCGTCAVPLIDAHFTSGADGFTYADNTFRSTTQSAYASGTVSSQALTVALGGVNETDVLNMSGGWVRNFTLSAPAAVQLSFAYTLEMSADYEPEECSEVLASIDNTLYGAPGGDFVIRRCDVAAESGVFSVTTPVLAAGTHTLRVGGFNNGKTTTSEATTIRIDDVVVR